MKFGGSSVANTNALTQVLHIVLNQQSQWDRLILVASALEGVTDKLLKAGDDASKGDRRSYRRITARLRDRHRALIENLPLSNTERSGLQADIDQLLFDMMNICQELADNSSDETNETKIKRAEQITIVASYGEHLASRIIAALLRSHNLRGVAIDSTEIIITEGTEDKAIPNITLSNKRIEEHLHPMLDNGIIPVITGFISGTVEGKPTTLGRGGSDYTASIIAASIHADELWMWSIVDGLMTADPNHTENTEVIPELSYDEGAEFAYFGAYILHPHMIEPLSQHNIPLRIKNVLHSQKEGTIIHTAHSSNRVIKAVTSISGIALSANHNGSLSEITALVDKTFTQTINTHADVMIASQSSSRSFLTFITPTSAGIDATRKVVDVLKDNLTQEASLLGWNIHPVTIITVIGVQLNHHAGMLAKILDSLSNIPTLAYAQGASNCSFSIVLETENANNALQNIHTMIINSA